MAKFSVRNLSLAASAMILLGWGIHQALQPAPPPLLQGTVLEPKAQLADFNLVDSAGQPFTKQAFLGRWTVLSLGFTHCPDVCPTTLAYFRDELGQLPADTKAQFVFVGVDPERDPPAKLGAFVANFHPGIKAATGTEAELKKFAAIFSAYFKKEDEIEPGLYQMAHSPQYFLIDPEGRWQVLYTPPMAKGALAVDLSKLQAHSG